MNVSYGLSCLWEGGNSYFLGTTRPPLCSGMQLRTLFSPVYLTSISSQKTVMCCPFDPTSPKVVLLFSLRFSPHYDVLYKLYHLSVHTKSTSVALAVTETAECFEISIRFSSYEALEFSFYFILFFFWCKTI